nr:MFS transporter [Arsenicicoccus piscis]
MVAAAFVIAIGYGLISPVLPQFARSFDVGVAAASVVVSAFAFFRLVFAPLGGALIGRLGERPVYLLGLLIVAASTAATAFAQTYWQLLLFRGVGGIGSTMFTVSAMGLMVRLAPPSIRGRVSSAYATAFLLGGILGPVVGGVLAGLGMRMPFIVYAVALLVASAVVAVFLKDASLRPAPGTPVLAVMTVREALADSAYRAALVSSFANGWANFGVRVALLPLFAAVAVAGEPWVAGAALAIFAGGNAVALTLSGRLTDVRGRRPLVIAGLVVSGVATIAFGLASALVPFFVLSAVAGLGTGLLGPGQQAAVADVIGRDRSGGKVLAAFQMSSDLGAILGPVLAGVLADRLGFGWAFGVTGLVLLVGALAWLPARETMPAADQDAGR